MNLQNLLLILTMIIALACASKSSKKATDSTDFNITEISDKRQIWKRKQVFVSSQEAMSYALDRRQTIQRFHQLRSGPYFGTPAQKECASSIDVKGEIIDAGFSKYFFLKVLANDFYAMCDCLKENNTQEAYYEFYLCEDGRLYEFRYYQPLQSPVPDRQVNLCGSDEF